MKHGKIELKRRDEEEEEYKNEERRAGVKAEAGRQAGREGGRKAGRQAGRQVHGSGVEFVLLAGSVSHAPDRLIPLLNFPAPRSGSPNKIRVFASWGRLHMHACWVRVSVIQARFIYCFLSRFSSCQSLR
ncbi:hypothetical protein Pmani_018675 [Petrolisthes manimaculis]|uniref:Uncharacterized protein n=1 Tax=Petrolisthes manimaculis TaxID=1843537 RepID=A0AAE1U4N5_9EUCA|nr:hypothetical protein Pmani_018675 [Petrolisthes manimaculis]